MERPFVSNLIMLSHFWWLVSEYYEFLVKWPTFARIVAVSRKRTSQEAGSEMKHDGISTTY